MKERKTQFLATLNRNVDDWYADRIDYRTFDARQRATWDAIRASGHAVERSVLRALRDRLPPVQRASWKKEVIDLEAHESLRHLARHGAGTRRRGEQ